MNNLRWHVTARDGEHDYAVRPSETHPGTYVLRIADTATNKERAKRNSFATIPAALEAAEQWRREHTKEGDNGKHFAK